MKLRAATVVIAVVAASMRLVPGDDLPSLDWPQWGQGPEHRGSVSVAGQPIAAQLANVIYDPLLPEEQAFAGGDLVAHYQVPLLDGQDVFMEFKTGTYSRPFNSQVWQEARLHWE